MTRGSKTAASGSVVGLCPDGTGSVAAANGPAGCEAAASGVAKEAM